MLANRSTFSVKKMAEVLDVSESGFHAWKNRLLTANKKTEKIRERTEWEELLEKILKIFIDNNAAYGARRIKHALWRLHRLRVNRKRVKKIMESAGIISKLYCPTKNQTTDSKHRLPVAENILNRQFWAAIPNQKWVTDMTYIWTCEGWLYHAAIIDLCGRKVIGSATSANIDTELAIAALNDAVNRVGAKNSKGVMLHSDRGSVYCSRRYRNLMTAYGITCSMSRKGNCWDNAPMESFWGKMKGEWLNDFVFQTREDASNEVFKYVWTYYNSKRIHSTNGYVTPDEFYNAHQAA
jgi:putative transposase